MITRSDLMAHLAELRVAVPSLAEPQPDDRVRAGATAVFLQGPKNRYRVVLNGDYLGCAMTVDPRPGEDWRRGRDLPDGQATLATWLKIAAAIKEHEA